jgi:[acyl-carrier-protein] S-malonyltransferase
MPKLALLFPGQGAQYVGMGQELAATSAPARQCFERAAEVLGYNLLALCRDGPETRLNATDVSQPAIYVASLAALAALREQQPELMDQVVAAAGLSLGEYTALTAAGTWSFEDGLRVVMRRGQAMQAAAEATPSGMVSILGLDIPTIDRLCQQASAHGRIRIANYLCPGNIVVSGELAACAAIEEMAVAAGAMKTVRLAVAGAFHSEIMKPADSALAEALASVALHEARFPVWSNVDAQPHTRPDEFRQLLVRQVLEPVQWEAIIRGLLAAGVDQFCEIGPGRVLAGLLKRIHRKAECINVAA